MASTATLRKSLINNTLQKWHIYKGEKDIKRIKKQYGGNLYKDDMQIVDNEDTFFCWSLQYHYLKSSYVYSTKQASEHAGIGIGAGRY